MGKLAFERIAITAFLEPGGLGPLWVWRVSASRIFDICAAKPSFDPTCEIESLLIGGCERGAHPGRHALELIFCASMSRPGELPILRSASAMGHRASVLIGSTPAKSLDLEIGFLDLLIHAPRDEEHLPRWARIDPAKALAQSFHALWGVAPIFCGCVEEEDWDTYGERAAAVLSIIERSEIEESSGSNAASAASQRL